jgi:hypothetical protein
MNANLVAISEKLKTQDNRMTQNPMFCVQEKKRIVGMDANYASETVWVNMTSGDAEESKDPPPLDQIDDWEEFGVLEYWQTVMVAFTEAGCQQYLRLNGHNHHGETRIYVESFNRCPEMIAIREMILAGAATTTEPIKDVIL